MKPLSENYYQLHCQEKVNNIFSNLNPYGKPFRNNIKPRLLLYDFRWGLHEPWIEPFVKTMNKLEEKYFYVTAIARPEAEKQKIPYHWYVPIEETADYISVVYSQETVIYSPVGSWGIICSDEDHALAGGSNILINEIKKSVKDLDARVYELIELWAYYYEQNSVDLSWLPKQLEHVYGQKKMVKFLSNSKLAFLLKN